MKLATREAPIAQYAQTLGREIALVADHLPKRMKVSHLHWGGGTPTALVPDDLERLMDLVHAHFDVKPDAELAIESDPRTLTPEMIERIGQLGFTRASFGVQEFDAKVQAAINRVQPPDMVRDSVDGLRKSGVRGINFDLIYGLPHQSVDTLLETIRICADMAPDRVALFGYAHVPWMAKKQRLIDETALPGASERLDQAHAAAQALKDAGYVALGLDHFALPDDSLTLAAKAGQLRRNFQGYTNDQAETMLGLGATSIGRTPNSYVQNTIETGAWARAVENGTLPTAKGCPISGQDKMRGHVIEHLMCQGKVDLHSAADLFGFPQDWYADALPSLIDMKHDGLVTFSQGALCVTALGAPVVRVIASLFDEYFGSTTARHAIAV
jgi:oxygen-independent coproporphyrinogen-3 oxidase